MIRLHEFFQRASAHRWRGLALLVLVALLLAVLLIHTAEHWLYGGATLLCGLVAVVFAAVRRAGSTAPTILRPPPAAGRAPPRRATTPLNGPSFVPLRA